MAKESTPLLKTKFHVPYTRSNLVLRPRLIGRLEDAVRQQHRLVLVSARAGAGKTTLVSEWLRQQGRPSAWLSLDAQDNDPLRFFGYLVGSLRQLDLTIHLMEWENLELPAPETLVTELINDIAASATSFLLVLDDYHLIENSWIHQAIEFLIEHQPPEMHLILTTRMDPPLPLAQLRVRGQLTEVRDRDLLFTEDETSKFFNQVLELELPASAVATIERRTEGWAAGLQMAAISIQGHKQGGDLDAFLHAFGGTNRFVLDYLMEEVLHQQSASIQDFLIETSILEQMCGELCDAVRTEKTGSSDSQSTLLQLERTNLFVIPLDDERRWYRYHHLFADLLQSILRQRRSAEQIHELHWRASLWYEERQLLGDAMRHIMAAQDFERAASMIDDNIVGLIDVYTRGKVPLLLHWVEKLPEEIRRSRPWLDVYRANMLALSLQLDEVEPILDSVEQRVDRNSSRAPDILGHVAAVRAYAANVSGDIERAIEMADLVKVYLTGQDNLIARATAAYALADTYSATDQVERASQALLDLIRIGEKTGQLLIIVPASCELAALKRVQGRLHETENLLSKVYQWLVDRNGLDSRVRCSYEFALADLLRERNELDAAYQHVMTGLEFRSRLGGYNVIGDLALMRVLQSQGDTEGALKALHAAERAVQIYPFQLALMIDFKAARVVQWLAAGDVDMARRWATECNNGSEQEQIALARLKLAQGHASEAQKTLVQQGSTAESGGRIGRLIEILALQAIALDIQGQSAEADATLSQAISLAQPEGYMRVFLDLGQPLQKILQRVANGATSAGGPRRTLLNAFQHEGARESALNASTTTMLIDPLTSRELEVLRLLAEGLSNKDIASRLIVAPGTIKQHLKNICRKLDVHGRMQAVRRGHELKIL
ncbi:MAG: LuxR C-terminal-related transcriptional regulator [Anaerolineales bacterium]